MKCNHSLSIALQFQSIIIFVGSVFIFASRWCQPSVPYWNRRNMRGRRPSLLERAAWMSSYEGSSVRSPSAATAGLLRSIFVATLLMSVAVTLAKTKKSEGRGLLIDIFLANICLPERTSEFYGTDITYLSHVMQLLSNVHCHSKVLGSASQNYL